MEILGYVLAAIVGVSLGLIGSGGSILTVPILVYVMGINPLLATAYSLFIVGSTALVGGVQRAIQKKVDIKTVFIFGAPSIAAVYATRVWLVPLIPDEILSLGSLIITKSIALLLLFAAVMILASISMIKSAKEKETTHEKKPVFYNYPLILINGAVVGLLTGLIGVGGGFLIIPALVLLARMPMKIAVGTSLLIIAANSLIGFMGDLQGGYVFDWRLLASFTGLAVIGIFIGSWLSKKVSADKLKKAVGWFVLAMGIYIIFREIFFSTSGRH